jgi:hypothetical protein
MKSIAASGFLTSETTSRPASPVMKFLVISFILIFSGRVSGRVSVRV